VLKTLVVTSPIWTLLNLGKGKPPWSRMPGSDSHKEGKTHQAEKHLKNWKQMGYIWVRNFENGIKPTIVEDQRAKRPLIWSYLGSTDVCKFLWPYSIAWPFFPRLTCKRWLPVARCLCGNKLGPLCCLQELPTQQTASFSRLQHS